MGFETLYQEVFEASSKKKWSMGLEIARALRVQEVTSKKYIVTDNTKAADQEIILDLVDLDWICSCASDEDPCEHVAATLIALKMQADKKVEIKRYQSDKWQIEYQFVKELNNCLSIKRYFTRVDGSGKEIKEPVKHSVLSIVSGRIEGPKVSAKPYDLEIDRILSGDFGARVDGYISTPRAWMLLVNHLDALTESQTVMFEDKVVRINKNKKAAKILELRPENGGYLVKLLPNDEIVHEFGNGVCLYNGSDGLEIRIMTKNDLPPQIVEDLTSGRFFSEREKVELFSKLLPELKKRFKVLDVGVGESATYERVGYCVKNNILGPRKVETSFHLSYGDPVKAYLDGNDLQCLSKVVPYRQTEKELTKRREFEREYGLELSKAYVFEDEELFGWVNKVTRFRLPFIGDDLDNLKVVGKSPILTKLLSDEIQFEVEIDDEEYEVSPEDLLEVYDRKSKYLKTDRGYVEVGLDWLDEYHDLLRSFVVSKKGKQKKGLAALEKMRILEGFGFSPPKKLKAYKENLFSSRDNFDFKILHASLRAYQTQGVLWLNKLKNAGLGALLADDMGLGKTLQSLAVFEKRTLVICPTSLVFNWKNELNQFRPDLSVSVYHGLKRKIIPDSDVTITTYGLLRSDQKELSELNWKIICVDEAQVIKNPQSKAAQALWSLSADFKLALTGTPIENHYKDLWSIFNFIAPGLLGELKYFEKFVVNPIQAENNEKALSNLRSRVEQFILRRSKKEVLAELPEKTEVINYCELTEEQNAAYENYLSGVKTKVAAEQIKPLQVFELILRLRQFACDPRLVDANYSGGSGKVEMFKSLISEVVAENHKSLVFSQWTSFLDLIEKELRVLGIKSYRLDGTTKNREEIVSKYNADADACVFLLSLKAGGVGLNLTSADHVFLLDPWWNPATERQAIDRAHRIGQENPVLIHRLVGKNTIEEKVIKLQKLKEQMSDMVLGNMDNATISKNELLSLLE